MQMFSYPFSVVLLIISKDDPNQIKFLASSLLALYIQSMPDEKPKKLANVIFPLRPLPELTYLVPSFLGSQIKVGHRILAPIGREKECGFIVGFPDYTEINGLKLIEDLVEQEPVLTSDLIILSRWISDYYMVSLGEAIRAMLPAPLHRESRLFIQRTKIDFNRQSLTEIQKKLLSVLQKMELADFEKLKKQFHSKNLRSEIRKLESMQLICCHYTPDNSFSPSIRKSIAVHEIPESFELINLEKKAPKQAAVLKQLIHHGVEVEYGPDWDMTILKKLEKRGLIEIREHESYRDAYSHIKQVPQKSIRLTADQSAAVQNIGHGLDRNIFSPYLLFGVTASGKTQVYLEIVQNALDRGKTALILIPEISLTPQAVQRYKSRFGNLVAVMHSRMSQGERHDSWKKLRNRTCRIALGPRSAIFAPLERLGVIIVDEEHDSSYKQNDPAPRYHARDLAVMRAKQNQCVIILGSATPSLETYANAVQGKYQLCSLPERIDRVPMPRIFLVDKNGLPDSAKSKTLSPLLYQKLQACHQLHEQTILLQNRRGYATYLRCKACGFIESCANCDLTLTYHQTDRQLKCHLCGFQKQAPTLCAKCGGANLRYRGAGTQKVEEEIHQFFPEMHLLRMDLDTTRTKHAHSRIIAAFENKEADILLGTQMVSKGHDFPGVNLVGIISADTGLLFPDFRSEERTFQMLLQAAGRAGRRNRQGEVVIQTYYPEHPLFQFVLNQEYEAFFRYAMKNREPFNYPPYGRLIAVRFRSGDFQQGVKASNLFFHMLPRSEKYEILGPVSSPISKKKGQYRFQIIIRASRRLDPAGRDMREAIHMAVNKYQDSAHFPKVYMAIDVDPVDVL
jgi:primosomal protein N' (replication factor Y)